MKSILITGANGEIGHELITELDLKGVSKIITLDINPLDDELAKLVQKQVTGDILNSDLLESLFNEFKFDVVFHLAAMLSTSAERDPVKAHHVNTDGSINLLSLSERFSRSHQKEVVFVFPSSIAVYGLPNTKTAHAVGKIKENQWNKPATMYGCNKLYVELLGNYYERYYIKDSNSKSGLFDFRSLRFPGLLSANTMPTGGTSDFGPEIIHSAAKGQQYNCFVRKDSALPFMVMPDAVKALIMLSETDKKSLRNDNYNVGSFAITAGEIATIAKKHFNWDNIKYVPDQKRQAIVDSWPENVDDSKARADWGWKPDFNKEKSFKNYLIPAIKQKYSS